jgi:hypothetical protein
LRARNLYTDEIEAALSPERMANPD